MMLLSSSACRIIPVVRNYFVMSDNEKEVRDFDGEVIEHSFQIPVLVDFWAPWCGPCKTLTPILEKLAAEASGSWELRTVNTEVQDEIALSYGIQSIPSVKLFSRGQVVAEFVGAIPEYAVRSWLAKNVPGKEASLIADAETLIGNRKIAEGRAILEEVLQHEPGNVEARVLLAPILLYTDTDRALQLVLAVDDPKFSDTTETIAVFHHLLQAANRPEILPQAECRQRYAEACRFLQSQDFERALGEFIGLIRTDRSYDDDGARKACIAIFKYLGEDHPTTLRYRREFSNALY